LLLLSSVFSRSFSDLFSCSGSPAPASSQTSALAIPRCSSSPPHPTLLLRLLSLLSSTCSCSFFGLCSCSFSGLCSCVFSEVFSCSFLKSFLLF
jgi:hypothetical protein